MHHLLQAPIPNWLKVISIIGSIALFIPVFTFNTNLFMTMRGHWGQMLENIPLRFVLTGAFFYLAVSFQGSIQSLMSVNRFVHFTQWVVAHAHLALLGAFGFIAAGAMLYMVPQIVRKPLWSRNLADAQYWLMLLGINGFFWALTAAGLAQASAWVTLGEQVVESLSGRQAVLLPALGLRRHDRGRRLDAVDQPGDDHSPAQAQRRRRSGVKQTRRPAGDCRALVD